MDEADRAAEIMERAMSRFRRPDAQRAAILRTHCIDCGEAMPNSRIQRHAQLCVECQTERERRG